MEDALHDERRDTTVTHPLGWFEVFDGSADSVG
jgi:hypothetical protein